MYMKALILAAWFGTRMLPITKVIPKEMLPVWEKPLIQHTVEALVRAWCHDIICVTSQSKKAIEDYFDKNFELESLLIKKWKTKELAMVQETKDLANMVFIRQKEQLWVWHAILQAQSWIHDDFFLVLNGDDLYHPEALKDMITLHQKTRKAVVLLQEVPKDDVYKWWIAEVVGWCIRRIVEKPAVADAPSQLANTWAVIYPREIFSHLQSTQIDQKLWEILPREALQYIMDQWNVLPYVSDYPRRPVWTWDQLLSVNKSYAETGSIFW